MQKFYPSEIIEKLKQGENNLQVSKLSQEIEALKTQFEETDYKTTKMIQYENMGLELPYSWEDIYREAEEIRIQIREREKELHNLLQLGE